MSLGAWMHLWDACHVAGFAGPTRAEWPDGQSVLEQPALTVAMFDLIAEAVAAHMESEQQAEARRRV